LSFLDDVGNFFSDAGKVAEGTAVGAGVGFLTGGPLGALLGGAYGVGKGIYGLENGTPTSRSIYQTVLPAAGLGLAAGLTLPGATAQLSAAQPQVITGFAADGTPILGASPAAAAPTQAQILGAQLNVLGGTASAAPSAIATGTNSVVSSLETGLSKFATQGALVGVASTFFKSAAGVKLPTPTGLPTPGPLVIAGGGAPSPAPVVVAGAAPQPQAAAVNPLLVIAAIGVGAWFLFGDHKHHTAHA
jgi:hypothetical protein